MTTVQFTALAAFAAATLAAGCTEDELRELHPRISVCLTDDAPADDCDGTLDLGEIPATRATKIDLFILNRGDGPLAVSRATVDDVEVAVGPPPPQVAPGGAEPLSLTITTSEALGERSVPLTIISDDNTKREHQVVLVFLAVPPPNPRAVWCDGDDEDATCAPELDLVLTARPTQQASRVAWLRNDGDAPLAIEEIQHQGSDEISIESSTGDGELPPAGVVPFLIAYRPVGDGDAEADVVLVSDDPRDPPPVLHVRGESGDNLPPTAVAMDGATQAVATAVLVDQQVGVVGGGSSDPEGDPLVYRWTLQAPAGSTAAIADPAAENALFVPDVRGAYAVTLVVTDSLGQDSAPAVVTIDAAPRYTFRARLTWPGGGDLDVHLVQAGSAPFSATDVYFAQRAVPVGDPTTALDDGLLLDDAIAGPGVESAAIAQPVPGTWEVWVQLFDEAGLGAVDATIDIVIDDSAVPIATITRSLSASCDLWHAVDVELPAATATVIDAAPISQCL